MLQLYNPKIHGLLELNQVYWKFMLNNKLSKRVCWFPEGTRYTRETLFIEIK